MFFESKAASMYFWSVSLVDQLSSQFHIFLVDQKPISHFFGRPICFLVNQKPFSHVFGRPIFILVDQIYFWSTKKKKFTCNKLMPSKIKKTFFF